MAVNADDDALGQNAPASEIRDDSKGNINIEQNHLPITNNDTFYSLHFVETPSCHRIWICWESYNSFRLQLSRLGLQNGELLYSVKELNLEHPKK